MTLCGNNQLCAPAESGSMFTGGVKLGDVGHGRFSFDTETPQDIEFQPPTAQGTFIQYRGAAAKNDSFLRLGNAGAAFQQGAATSSHPVIEVLNDYAPPWDPQPYDYFSYAARQDMGDYFYQELSLEFVDTSTTALTGGGIPSTLDGLGGRLGLGYGNFSFFSGSSIYGDSTIARGTITSLTLAAPVPEPETYAMLLAGLGMLAWRRKRAGARAA